MSATPGAERVLNNHVILCGLGELGFRVLERLRAFGEQVVVFEPAPQPNFREKCAEWGVPLVLDTGRQPQALRDAGLLTARAVIAATGDDLTNLAIALAAHEENPDARIVVRLFNPRLIDKLERELPHCRALDLAALSATVFAYASLYDDVLHCINLPDGRYLLRRFAGMPPAHALPIAVLRDNRGFHDAGGMGFSITARPEWEILPGELGTLTERDQVYALVRADEGAHWDARVQSPRLRRLVRGARRRFDAARRHPLLPVLLILLALAGVSAQLFERALHLTWSQALYFVVTILTTTGFGDISLKNSSPTLLLYGTALMLVGAMLMAVLYAFLTDALLSMRFASLFGRRPLPQRRHFILAGFGTVGFRIADELAAMGHPIVAIERQENSRLVQQARARGIPVVVSPDVFNALQELNLDEARGLLAVTDDDTLNLELAFMAQEHNPHMRVVVRQFDPHMATLLERSFGIQLSRSPSAIAAPAFAVAASADDLLDAFDLGSELWCVGRLTIPAGHRLAGTAVADLWRVEVLPLSLQRGEKTVQAPFDGEWTMQEGDTWVIVTPHARWISWKGTARSLAH